MTCSDELSEFHVDPGLSRLGVGVHVAVQTQVKDAAAYVQAVLSV